ncbi:L-serine ammonia-lyase, iron-sulfur-dependent, subunit alpha [Culicoidibacter larvae]|uniref:L-serine ammonia-lyase, iron-sulfur-dependent, subunit alpha n=1 Tax=Culicoidibacter larvae TaxID=2579976 RepID=UPI003BB21A10
MFVYSIADIYKIGFGPSSSHTMGPQRAAELFRERFPESVRFAVVLYGSLALTGKGHLTDYIIAKTLGEDRVEFDWEVTVNMPRHSNAMRIRGFDANDELTGDWLVYSVGGGEIEIEGEVTREAAIYVYPHRTFADIAKWCCHQQISLVEYVDNFEPELGTYLTEVWQTMKQSIERGIHANGKLMGVLQVPRKAAMLYKKGTPSLRLSSYAYAVNEENASASSLVVTAPTCGASGTIPAVLRFAQEEAGYSDAAIIDALKVAGLIGNLVKTNASISGAEAGCQAEVGTATSMAAAALAQLRGFSIDIIEAAAEIAMEHQLGLTCDPVYGYVQIPCIQRNAVAAHLAQTSCELAEQLCETELVSFDTVVQVMYETGKDLPYAYRETAQGGLAKHFNNYD